MATTGIASANGALPSGGFHQPVYHTDLYGTVLHPFQNPNAYHTPVVFGASFGQIAPVQRASPVSRVMTSYTPRAVQTVTPSF
jgi:hypothetical protein